MIYFKQFFTVAYKSLTISFLVFVCFKYDIFQFVYSVLLFACHFVFQHLIQCRIVQSFFHLLHRSLVIKLTVQHCCVLLPPHHEFVHLLLASRIKMKPEFLFNHKVAKRSELLRDLPHLQLHNTAVKSQRFLPLHQSVCRFLLHHNKLKTINLKIRMEIITQIWLQICQCHRSCC